MRIASLAWVNHSELPKAKPWECGQAAPHSVPTKSSHNEVVRPEFKIGFQRRKRFYTSATSERERPVVMPMSIRIIEMPKDELDKLSGLTYYR